MKQLPQFKIEPPQVLLIIILFATLTRIAIPSFIAHPPNFAAIDALSLFCGAYFSRWTTAVLVALFSVWLGDLFLNRMFMGDWVLFYQGFYWQYISYFLITLIGITLKGKIHSIRLISSCLFASILFFVISNFGVWCSGSLYPLTLDGLMACYVAAIPFFKNTIFSDLFFSAILFGCFELIKISLPMSSVSHLLDLSE